MHLDQPIDIYCERTDPSFWAEPLNAVSNLAFILAALWAWHLAKKHNTLSLSNLILIALIGLIGTGSFLFHTFATRWAMLADVIPIGIFVFFYSYLAFKSFLNLSSVQSVILIFAYYGLTIGLLAFIKQSFSPNQVLLNGSLQYLPTLLGVLLIGYIAALKKQSDCRLMLLAGFLFFISLIFRTLDMTLCNQLVIGIHYLWHGLNGLVLALLFKVIMLRNLKASLL